MSESNQANRQCGKQPDSESQSKYECPVYTIEGRLSQYKSIADSQNADWHTVAKCYMHDFPGIFALLHFSWFCTSPSDHRYSGRTA